MMHDRPDFRPTAPGFCSDECHWHDHHHPRLQVRCRRRRVLMRLGADLSVAGQPHPVVDNPLRVPHLNIEYFLRELIYYYSSRAKNHLVMTRDGD